MSPRDEFAKAAMQSIIETWNNWGTGFPFGLDPTVDENDRQTLLVARCAYMFADSMIEASEEK